MREHCRHLFFLLGAICIISFALHPITHIEDALFFAENHAEEELSLPEDHESECELCSIAEESVDEHTSTEPHFGWLVSKDLGSTESSLYAVFTEFNARAPPL